jgi:hypothetical protein
MAFSHVSKPIKTVTGKTFARKFITLGRVINCWADAVGAELAEKTYPIGMKVRKSPRKEPGPSGLTRGPLAAQGPRPSPRAGGILTATLEIAANSADATLIHYQKGLILERLRTLLAADMIVDIKVTHAARPTIFTSPLAGKAHPRVKRTGQVGSHVDLSHIMDETLRDALASLGEYVT